MGMALAGSANSSNIAADICDRPTRCMFAVDGQSWVQGGIRLTCIVNASENDNGRLRHFDGDK